MGKFAKDCQMTCDACKGGDKPGKPCEDKIDTCAADLAADATKCKKDKKFARDCQMTCDACKGGGKPGKPCKDKGDTCADELGANATLCDNKMFKMKCQMTCDLQRRRQTWKAL